MLVPHVRRPGRRPARPLVAVLAAGLLSALVLGGSPATVQASGSSSAAAPDRTHEEVVSVADDFGAARTMDSVDRRIRALTAQIQRTTRALKACARKSGRAERVCRSRARAQLRSLRSQRATLQRQQKAAQQAASRPSQAVAAPVGTNPFDPDGDGVDPYWNKPATGYSLMWNAAHGVPRWACGPALTWRLNTANAPSNAAADARSAFALISQISGYSFTYAGTTSARGGSSAADIVVSFASGGVGGNGAIAVGGSSMQWGSSSGARLLKGFVTVDARQRFAAGMGTNGRSGVTLGRVLTHELGHVMGIGHVNDTTQIMNPVLFRQRTAANTGDRNGLRYQGRAKACAA